MNWDTILIITGMFCGAMWALQRKRKKTSDHELSPPLIGLPIGR